MKNLIEKSVILIHLLLCSFTVSSQNDSLNKLIDEQTDRKYIIWASPSKATHVYGLMFNVWIKDHPPFPKIYGVEFNICPVYAFAPFLVGLGSLDLPKSMNLDDDMIFLKK
jgi:hypothetical protein